MINILSWVKKPKNNLFDQRSKDWKKVRALHISKNPTCAACGRSSKLEVHHIEPIHISPAKELDENNLITLCDNPCHLAFGHLFNYKSWNPDVKKDCESFLEKVKNRPI